MQSLPLTLTRTLHEVHGRAGAEWLGRLPDLLADCAERWSLTLSPPYPNLSYHYVAPAVQRGGAAVVLKAGVPNPGLSAEIATLRHYAGNGAVRLLDSDGEHGLLLLERLEPGVTLVTMEEEAATRTAADVMRRLWRPAPEQPVFPTVADWCHGFERLRAQFDGGTGPLPARLIVEAETLVRELVASQDATVLLHGDLHHGNILSATRAPFLAIDPKGVLGEPAFEAAQFLLNPSPPPAHILARRLDIFAEELGLDRARLRGWGLIKALLSAWWTLEDHGQVEEEALAYAQALAALPE